MRESEFARQVLPEAGKLAMSRFRRISPSVKSDRTFVTEADLTIQELLIGQIRSQFPCDGIIGEEENLRRAPETGSRTWIIDPIDGTASFVAGLPVWGIGLGLVEAGRARAGFFFMPVTGELFSTSGDGRVLLNGEPTPMPPAQAFDAETAFLVGSRFHQRFDVSEKYPGKVRNFGSTIAHLCYVATGPSSAAVLEDVFIWDLVPGLAMLQANGGALRYLDGEAVSIADYLSGRRVERAMLAGRAETLGRLALLLRDRLS